VIVSFSGIELSAPTGRRRHPLAHRPVIAASGHARAELLYRRAADLRGGTFFPRAADDLPTAVRVNAGETAVLVQPAAV